MNVDQLYREVLKTSPKEQAALFAKAWGIRGGSGVTEPQALASAIAYAPQALSTVSVDFTAIASTDVVNATEKGILQEIGVEVSANVTGTTPIITLDITIDGGATRSIELYTSALLWSPAFRALVMKQSGNVGDTALDSGALVLAIPYLVSLQVAVDVATAAGTAGAATFSVLRGIQL